MELLTLCAACALVLVSAGGHAAASGLFEIFTQCRVSDTACVQEAVQQGAKNYAHTGLPEHHLRQFDPLHVDEIKSHRNANSPFNVDLTFRDLDITGLADLKVQQMTPLDVTKRKAMLEVQIPKLLLRGQYEVHGNILILPITGKGKATILLENNRARITLIFQDEAKSSAAYGQLQEVKIQLVPKHAVYKLEGLFNGNRELSESMHAVLNENSLDIYDEIAPNIKRAVGVVIKDLLNEFFEHNKYEQLWL